MTILSPIDDLPAPRERLRFLIRTRSLLTGGRYTLASGRESSLFFDMKRTMFDPEGINLLAEAILEEIADGEADAVGGLVMGAVPLVAAVCARSAGRTHPLNGFYVRKEAKDHGTAKLVDGNLQAGDRAVILEDVTTTGGSALKAVDAVVAAGGEAVKVITVVDRLEGAADAFNARGLTFRAIFTRDHFE